MPSIFPFISGITFTTAFAAPVVVGMIFSDAVLALLKSEWGWSRTLWSFVKEWIVDINAFWIPNWSLITLTIGATQFVVQDALEIILCFIVSYSFSLTPKTIVMSSSVAGAEIITYFTVPCKCFSASLLLVKIPVLSITMSTS